MVTMLYKTNIFGIVGSDNNKEYKQNQVVIWDDFANKILYKITLNEKVLKKVENKDNNEEEIDQDVILIENQKLKNEIK